MIFLIPNIIITLIIIMDHIGALIKLIFILIVIIVDLSLFYCNIFWYFNIVSDNTCSTLLHFSNFLVNIYRTK